MIHDNPEILAKLARPIGKKVSYKFPGKEKHKHGTLQDRVIVPSNPGTKGEKTRDSHEWHFHKP